MKFLTKVIVVFTLIGTFSSCKKYLDVVPDNIATIDYAFRMRLTAQKYLYTCYSYMPPVGDLQTGFITAGDEIWLPFYPFQYGSIKPIVPWEIARGNQNVNDPYLDYWNGLKTGVALWQGIRDCNIFLENIAKVPDMDDSEKDKWIGEVKFLKAYYHFFLLSIYGPIPIVKENLPISAGVDDVKIFRRPADEGFDYIVQLLDEAATTLPNAVQDVNSELGRVTKPMAMGLKAKVLVYAASPLYNGNTDYSNFKNKDGLQLISQSYSQQKWERAEQASKEAVELCVGLGYKLYEFKEAGQSQNLSPETKSKLNLRNIITERWNSEIIWADPNTNTTFLQNNATPRFDVSIASNSNLYSNLAVPFKIASLFYTKNGLPITADNTWSYSSRFNLRQGTSAEKYFIKEGYTTAEFNFNREPRFYADLLFDGGILYGQGRFDEANSYYLQSKVGQVSGKSGVFANSISGYYPKKYISYTNTPTATTYPILNYPWVLMRLADLYLLYAEAANEVSGPSNPAVFQYLNLVRKRAGIPTVQDSWTNFSNNPGKITTKEGLREIIHAERYAELALEGHRFFDVRRWKEAPQELNKPLSGWDVNQETNEAYYREKVFFRPTFVQKDYFWPLRQNDLIINKNLVQNPGW